MFFKHVSWYHCSINFTSDNFYVIFSMIVDYLSHKQTVTSQWYTTHGVMCLIKRSQIREWPFNTSKGGQEN